MKKWILLSSISLFLFSCEKEKQSCPGANEKNFALSGFTKINAGETFNVTVTKAAEFSVKASGCASDLADLELTISNGGFLELNYKTWKKDRYRVDFAITLPQLITLNLSGAAMGSIKGFAGQNVVIKNILSGAAQCTMQGTATNAQVELSGTSVLNLTGLTENLYGNISGNAHLNCYGVDAKEVDISASGASKAYVRPLQILFAEASGESRIYYKGSPGVANVVTSGNGKVIHE